MRINPNRMGSAASGRKSVTGYGRSADLASALLVWLVIGTATVAPAAAQSQGPNAPSTVVNDPSTGTDPWNNPQGAAVSDDNKAFIGSPTNFNTYYLKATGYGFAIPNGAVIEGIQVDVEKLGAFPAFDTAARIVKGGAIGATDKSNPASWTFPDNVVTYGGSSDLWGETWTAAAINGANFGFALAAFGSDTFIAVDAISITVFYSTNCGNSLIDVNEDCDDGNTADVDCCSSTCHFDGPGTPCPDSTLCNGDETCDGAGTCQPGTPLACDDHDLCTQDSCDPIGGCVNDGSPVGGCRTALKSILILKDKSPDSKDKLVWKWVKGQSTAQSEFGVPTGTTQYAVCIHAGTAAALLANYNVPSSAMKWSTIGTKGYKYTDPPAARPASPRSSSRAARRTRRSAW